MLQEVGGFGGPHLFFVGSSDNDPYALSIEIFTLRAQFAKEIVNLRNEP
jgi:hypothetical protein